MRVLGGLLLSVLLGVLYADGADSKVDVVFQHAPKRTHPFDQILAEAGDRSAQFQAGLALETGAGTDQNHSEAVKWYRKAADQGARRAK